MKKRKKWTLSHSLNDPKENPTFYKKIKCMVRFVIYKIQGNKKKRNVYH